MMSCWPSRSNASTDRTWSAWVFCRCGSCPAKWPTHWAGRTRSFTVRGLACTEPGSYPRTVTVEADGVAFRATVGLDTEREQTCHRHGGIMPYVLRNLLR
jgi:hypothetical protein